MKQNKLGSTDILVSELALGTVKFGRNSQVKYPHPFDLPSMKQLSSLLDLAAELGINTIDTAPAYGHSEQRLGQLLAGKRDQWVIIGKAGESFSNGQSQYDFTRSHIINSVKKSLQQLQTNYLDVLLIHSNGKDTNIIEQYEVFTTLADLKQQGHIRAFGMSTKSVAGGLLTVQQADVVMLSYHPEYTDEHTVIQAAHQQKKGVLIKKPLASGHAAQAPDVRQDPVKRNFDFILKQPAVSSIVVGTINPDHLKHNVAAIPKR